MDRIYNFGAGPAMLPKEVFERARAELFLLDGAIPLPEADPSSEKFKKILRACETNIRKLMNIPSNYRVIFVDGAGMTQFSAIPMNLLSERKRADYIVTGQYSNMAYHEAKKYGDIIIAASSAGANPIFSAIPKVSSSDFRPDADYVYMCYNNAIYGTKFDEIPDTGNIPLVADMTSSILSEPIEVPRFGMIYADLSVAIAPAAITLIVIREDLIGNARPDTPVALSYKNLADGGVYSGTAIYGVYMVNLVLEWIISLGGLDEMKRRNERKAGQLYDFIDGHEYFTASANKRFRSMTNVIFTTGVPELDNKFISLAREQGLYNLEGHMSVGGMRASLYNAMAYDGVDRLIRLMQKFMRENPKFDDL